LSATHRLQHRATGKDNDVRPPSPASPTTRMRTLSMASASEALGTDDPAPVRDDHIDLECEKRGKGARGRENCFFSF